MVASRPSRSGPVPLSMADAVKTSEPKMPIGAKSDPVPLWGGISTSEPKMPIGSEGGTMGLGGVREDAALPGAAKLAARGGVATMGPGAEIGCTGGKGSSGGRKLVSRKGGSLKRFTSSVGKGPRPNKGPESGTIDAAAPLEEPTSVGARVDEADSPISSVSLTSAETPGGEAKTPGGGDKALAFLGAPWGTQKDPHGGGR